MSERSITEQQKMEQRERTGTYIKFMMVEDDDNPNGIELATFRDVSTVPREGELILLSTYKYEVIEQGVLWTFTENGAFVTIVLVPYENEEDR